MAGRGGPVSPDVGMDAAAARAVVREHGTEQDLTKDRSPETKRAAVILERQRRGEQPGQIIREMRRRIQERGRDQGLENPPAPGETLTEEAANRVTNGINQEFTRELYDSDGNNIRETDPALKANSEKTVRIFELQRMVAEGRFHEITDPAEKKIIIDQVKEAITGSREMRDAMAHMNADQRKQFYENIASSAMFREVMAGKLVLLDPDQRGPLIDPAITTEYDEALAAFREKGEVEQQLAEARRDRTKLTTYREFTQKNEVDRVAQITTLYTTIPAIDGNIASAQADIADPGYVGDRDARRAELEGFRAQRQETLATLRLFNSVNRDILANPDPAARQAELATTFDNALNSPTGINTQIANLEGHLNTLTDDEQNQRKQRLDRALEARKNAELAATSLQGELGIQEATADWLEEQLDANQALNEEYERSGDHLRTPEGMIDARMMDRWTERRQGRFKNTERDDVAQITRDFNRLMSGDIEGILADLTQGMPPEERQKLMNDPKFKTRVTTRLLHYRAKHGGITPVDAMALMNTEWGDAAIDNMVKANSKFMKNISELEDAGLMPGGFKQWLRRQSGANLALILMGIIVGVPLTAIAGTLVAPALGAGLAATGAATSFFGSNRSGYSGMEAA